jgi:hypothetical protein
MRVQNAFFSYVFPRDEFLLWLWKLKLKLNPHSRVFRENLIRSKRAEGLSHHSAGGNEVEIMKNFQTGDKLLLPDHCKFTSNTFHLTLHNLSSQSCVVKYTWRKVTLDYMPEANNIVNICLT